ncbi:MAG: glycosyltransferase family 39 protein [Chloroflexi bacterium]|nr:glycosyltransferase family 39 protein [Chloroflexota bacterium]
MGLVAGALLVYAALALPRLSRRLTLGLLVALAFGVGCLALAQALAPPIGLKASYWAAATPSGPPERSTDFPWLTDASRIDSKLDLRGEDFGVHFFNDASRFNFGPDVAPGRDQLPFSVRWQGWLLAPSAGERRFAIAAEGPAQVTLDGSPLEDNQDATRDLAAGLHLLQIDYSRPEARVPGLQVQWQRTPGGPLETLGGDDVRWRPDTGSTSLSDALTWLGRALVAGAIVVWLALGILRLVAGNMALTPSPLPEGEGARRTAVTPSRLPEGEGARRWWRAAIWLAPLLFLAYGMLLEAPAEGKATILSGLDDWLIYESSARDILLNGWRMDGGQGHAAAFYGQPLYPYVLAALHRVTGESLFGPLVVQFAALGAVVVGTAELARRAFGTLLDGLVAAAAFLVLLQLEPEHFKIARQLFNENLYMPLVMASLIVLVVLARRERPVAWWQALLAGVLLGLTTISRSQFLLCVPLGLLIVWLAWRRQPRAATLSIVLVCVGLTLAIAPVTARNWIVAGQFVPISSSGGASLLEFHRPPTGLVDQSAIERDPLYDALHLDQPTRTVVAFMRADPRGYLATLLPLAAHSIGLQGRNDPGVYWPLLVTVLLYAASFGLARTRKLHVWPIHAFVGTHLLVLMLFEADTYGYRLVMPMYAPMLAVAAQLPLEGVRRVLQSRAGAAMRSGSRPRAARFAVAGWGVVVLGALVWQAIGLADVWPERETSLHGLGGAAAHAALTSDRVAASAIYVASVDGTPRRFGAGSLPGLRFPWFKWFDPARSVPLPPASSTAVYVLSELNGQPPAGDLTACLGPPDAAGEVVMSGETVRDACARTLLSASALGASFDGVARIDAVQTPPSAAAGDTLETRLVWSPLAAHPPGYQLSLQLDDPSSGDGSLWGNGTLDLYPATEWQTDESLLSRLPVITDPTAFPQSYRMTLGLSRLEPNAPPALATWRGARTDRVPVSTIALSPASADAATPLPPDMRAVEGPGVRGGGLELLASRPLPPEAAIGSPLRLGLLWRATADAPGAKQLRVLLVGGNGEVVQDTGLPLLGGRVSPGSLHAGNVVRDEESLVVDPRALAESVSVEVALDDSEELRLGTLNLTGRAHVLDDSGQAPLATFGRAMELLSASVEPASVSGPDKVLVRLRWRTAAPMSTAYTVFVHVLDPSGQQVVAQRDAQPQDGNAPTTGWLVGEALDDTYTVQLPAGLAAGEYPIEVGAYDARSGARLTLANGDNRLILSTRLTVSR